MVSSSSALVDSQSLEGLPITPTTAPSAIIDDTLALHCRHLVILHHHLHHHLYKICDSPKSRGLLITYQSTESLWISCNSTSHRCIPFIRIHNLTLLYEELYPKSNLYIIQSYDPSRAQYNTMTALGPFMSSLTIFLT